MVGNGAHFGFTFSSHITDFNQVVVRCILKAMWQMFSSAINKVRNTIHAWFVSKPSHLHHIRHQSTTNQPPYTLALNCFPLLYLVSLSDIQPTIYSRRLKQLTTSYSCCFSLSNCFKPNGAKIWTPRAFRSRYAPSPAAWYSSSSSIFHWSRCFVCSCYQCAYSVPPWAW